MIFQRNVVAVPAPAVRAGDAGVSGFARRAAEASAEHARIVEWAARIRQADTAVAWLIARPGLRPPQASYPTAVEAYRETAEVLKVL